jgi:hypothetical protein
MGIFGKRASRSAETYKPWVVEKAVRALRPGQTRQGSDIYFDDFFGLYARDFTDSPTSGGTDYFLNSDGTGPAGGVDYTSTTPDVFPMTYDYAFSITAGEFPCLGTMRIVLQDRAASRFTLRGSIQERVGVSQGDITDFDLEFVYDALENLTVTGSMGFRATDGYEIDYTNVRYNETDDFFLSDWADSEGFNGTIAFYPDGGGDVTVFQGGQRLLTVRWDDEGNGVVEDAQGNVIYTFTDLDTQLIE